eukprot:gnl/Hemi2/18749_TR6205_c0_g1_i1.p1 gnl/Hemi2/18749_TR6205_c0_g1~~gnl/Hemi2/18749_TR6205_c0_g1_i1.p1  ORF type:complete len:132 (-),score=68.92 gnl/Hemi2/18749_TR6205_c0_g1_i1:238-633(-)
MDIAAEKAAFDAEVAAAADPNTRTETILNLNVGGRRFTTSRNTLCAFPGSHLEAIFSGRHRVQKDNEGCFFIDRDPNLFAIVLSYLRDRRHLRIPHEEEEQRIVVSEFEYYGITLERAEEEEDPKAGAKKK